MTSAREKMVLPVIVLALTIAGCGQKNANDKNAAQTTEFFKEIDNNAVPPENAEVVNETTPNAVEVVNPSSSEGGQTPVENITPTTNAELPDKPTPQNIQQALKNAKFYHGKVDGALGPKTKKAIEEFQTENGLKADGKVGPKTWLKLKSYLGSNESTAPAAETAPAAVGQAPATAAPAEGNAPQNGD